MYGNAGYVLTQCLKREGDNEGIEEKGRIKLNITRSNFHYTQRLVILTTTCFRLPCTAFLV